MKNKWYKCVFVLFASLFIFPLNSHAECDYKRMAELNRIASNVQINYSYDVENSTPIFKLFLSNITSDIYVEDGFGNTYENNAENIPIYLNYIYSFTIRSKDNACYGEKLLVKTIETPVFNSYSILPECKGKNSKKCGVWFDSSNLTYADYIDEENNAHVTKKTSQVKDTNLFNVILPIFGIATVIILILFVVVRKKR